ncbi:hypothetical protein Nepgr_012468 [Nepenthes gracilis]|uniref:Uncharacterized protein n=1 Tax=Nepenthes gracilis TaxID=150966 RepID=A0AAD3SG60_NEPGR|nr:hypothetical protein Nepgr_012468 [Nepenthes gracilis]
MLLDGFFARMGGIALFDLWRPLGMSLMLHSYGDGEADDNGGKRLLFLNCSLLYEAGFFAMKQCLVAKMAAGIYLDLGVQLFGFECRSCLVFGFGDSIASFWSPAWSPKRDAKVVVVKTYPRCCSLQLAV